MPGLDEDGNALTVDAAQKLFHKNGDTFYIPNQNFTSPSEANSRLIQGKMRIQHLMKQAKFL